ncbi:hypothetical protein HKCCE2091_07350 [Rhodobacterales bacterium HKCCE2091]|nr:hypothetical protein [Rhodobacterales bacterium HKCCE2091]
MANPVQQACVSSGRSAATPEMCACIGAAASMTLSSSDLRRAASFFEDPHRAQEVRMSDNRRDEQFWDRYLAFGEIAASMCN